MGMIALNLLLSLPQIVIQCYLVVKTVHMKRGWLYILIISLYTVTLYIINMWVLPQLQVYLSPIILLGNMAITYFFPWENRKEALFCTVIYNFAQMVTDVICTTVAMLLNGSSISLRGQMINDLTYMVVVKVAILALMLCLFLVAYALLRRYLRKISLEGVGLLFLLVPIAQLVSMILLCVLLQNNLELSRQWQAAVIILTVTALGVAANIVYFRSLMTMQQESVLRQQAALAEQQLGNQLAYYQKMEEDMLRINQMRHDMKNQLVSAYLLLKSGEKQAAQEQLDTLRASLSGPVGTVYCPNLIVDAVLAEKAAICQEKGIALDIRMEIPPQLPISGIHLCSMFANLMDNAIAGCLGSGAPAPKISLHAAFYQNKLVTRCEAGAPLSSVSPQSRPSSVAAEHGLGLGILQMLADRYEGELSTEQADGMFAVTMLL